MYAGFQIQSLSEEPHQFTRVIAIKKNSFPLPAEKWALFFRSIILFHTNWYSDAGFTRTMHYLQDWVPLHSILFSVLIIDDHARHRIHRECFQNSSYITYHSKRFFYLSSHVLFFSINAYAIFDYTVQFYQNYVGSTISNVFMRNNSVLDEKI